MSFRDLPEETESPTKLELYERLHLRLNQLGEKLNRFITSVEAQHNDLLNEDPSIYNNE
jgi:hypothetical protein